MSPRQSVEKFSIYIGTLLKRHLKPPLNAFRSRLEAIATRVEAVALGLEAIAIRLLLLEPSSHG